MKAKNYSLFLFLILALGIRLSAQEEFRFHNITADQGLSQSVVNCICQDKQGFIWIGTQDGLNRYDGNSILVYKNNPIDSNSLASNNINRIFEDDKGILWIGTDGGLSALNLYTGKFANYYVVNTIHKDINNVRALYHDKEGNIWIGTAFNSLSKMDVKGKLTTYSLALRDTTSGAYDYVSAITEDDKGHLWVASWGGGLYLFDENTGKYQNYYQPIDPHSPYRFINNLTTVAFNKNTHELLLGTNGSGMEAFNPESKTFRTCYQPTTDSLNEAQPKLITWITTDTKGQIWVTGTNGEGLSRYSQVDNVYIPYKRKRRNNSADFNEDFANCIFITNDNMMWIGTNNGADYYSPAKKNFTVYKDTVNTNANIIMSIAHDAGSNLWIGTNGSGLITYDEVTHTYSKNAVLNKLINNISILSLYIDKSYTLWIGSWGTGVLGYNLLTSKITHLDSINNAVAQTTVTAITQDYKDKVWVGTYDKGVFIYDEKNQTVDRLTVNNGLSDNRVYGFYQDSTHNMWICTDGGGLNCVHPDGKITCIKKTGGANSLSSNSVNCVYQDKENNLWIGTSIGLNKYNPRTKNFIHYFTKDGLPNDYIYNILPDRAGNLWISTNKGLVRFNPHDTNIAGSAFKSYDESDGLPANEFDEGACLKMPDGKMYFGTMKGTISFYPDKVTGNTHAPPVVITSCELFGKNFETDTVIGNKNHLKLSWKNNTISFSFVGLDYEMPAKNRYMYMLEGADAEWSPPTTRHFASYAQLPPGHYVFRVKACNNDGIWSPYGTAIYIDIVPPFWKTNWFYALCILLIIAGIFAFVSYRTGRIEKEKRVLEDKVEERTKELAQKNRDITSSIQYAKRIQQAILPPLDEIKQSLPESFVLYMPKDIVSGDFYWFGEKDGKAIMVAADCTGHGVPGALMSMIGHNLLNQIVHEKGITKPSAILNNLNGMVQAALKQGISNIDTTDGMDMALCCLDTTTRTVEFAGANRPLILGGNGELKKVDPDKMPIGGTQIGMERSFTNHTITLQKGEILYMFSDGYADQFGGDKGKKFMMKRFMDNLQQIKALPLKEQEKFLHTTIVQWQGHNEQVDDILVIGIRV